MSNSLHDRIHTAVTNSTSNEDAKAFTDIYVRSILVDAIGEGAEVDSFSSSDEFLVAGRYHNDTVIRAYLENEAPSKEECLELMSHINGLKITEDDVRSHSKDLLVAIKLAKRLNGAVEDVVVCYMDEHSSVDETVVTEFVERHWHF